MERIIPFPECRKIKGGSQEWWMGYGGLSRRKAQAEQPGIAWKVLLYTVIFLLSPLLFIGK